MESAGEDGRTGNWGRWGEDDERGTLNLITAEVRARAAAEVHSGRFVSLGLPVRPSPVLSGPFAPAEGELSPVRQTMVHTGVPAFADVISVTSHHPLMTHLDALSHQVLDGRVYPGRPAASAAGPAGVSHGSTTAFAAGIVTRGVLLDLAAEGPLPSGYSVTGADFDEAERRAGVRLEPGDALVVRLGWSMVPDPSRPMPGITADAVRWMHRRDVSLYAGDTGDAHPALDPAFPDPLHEIGLGRLGLPLVDGAELTELAAVCAELGRSGFLLAVAPPRIHGLTGVPVNPLAVF
ncbi:cyclase family protein [Amycolatopsis sp. PS_44_ISF1]|uniref:cyclase family protein n=1 Tax=Amycolatopsis sp. PS_44_ISF1 TaxID=2974917 RepID=UPI0028E05D85|nr:cyclase family protein [Amycolatopsis sp. PS_44_ISF1]MDT8911411.1 cyclase family protein [Amycolatopsis sp. PS_44_ISF1]